MMMKYIQRICLAMALPVSMCCTLSCNKYLDVQPEDRFVENQVYSDKASVYNMLNGIYLNLAKPTLYGENLTATTLDVMAQYYNCSSTIHPFYTTARYDYADAGTLERTTDIWNNAYTAILNINLFIQNVNGNQQILNENEKNLMLGEAYGLRAWLAFDMLRLFGPVYATDSVNTAIPYPVSPGSQTETLLPANKIVENILTDLNTAAKLLEQDPVRTAGIKIPEANADNFFSLRNRRMNYYAVKATTARVLLYRRDITGAGALAAAIIQEATPWFPWSPSAKSVPGTSNPDRIFSSEVIFGVENANMYTMQANRFAASLTFNLLAPLPQKLTTVYEGYLNDYRYRINFDIDNTSSNTEKTFFKYADISNKSLLYRRLQPVIRLSELYYIATECENDDNKAATWLNAVRFNRGLPPVSINGDKQVLLSKEYQKEFWGEGQLFYYYKRINQQTISNGSAPNVNIAMAGKYVVPLPLSETIFR